MNEYQTFSTINNVIIYMLIIHVLHYHYLCFISQLEHIYMQVNSNIDVFVRCFFQWLSFTQKYNDFLRK